MIRNVCGESPIICTVFEKVHQWHCGMWKTMYKQCFIQPFCIVNGIACGSNTKLWTKNETKMSSFFFDKFHSMGQTAVHTVRLLNMLLLRHHRKRSMAVDRPIDRQPMVRHIRIKIPYSNRFVGPNLSHTIYCPIVDLDFVMCHYPSAIFHELLNESIAVQHINEMLIYAHAPWHQPLLPNLVNLLYRLILNYAHRQFQSTLQT